eukprot:7248577-Alexandrium_andersonii.AAC.1
MHNRCKPSKLELRDSGMASELVSPAPVFALTQNLTMHWVIPVVPFRGGSAGVPRGFRGGSAG